MVLGIDPTVDYAFKRMLGSPEHTDVTVHFINAVFDRSPLITQVELLNPILGKETADDKLSILDVRARDDQGRWLNVEMQTTLPLGMRERLVYYVSHLYVRQLREGEGYSTLYPAVNISLLNRLMFAEIDDPHLDFRLRDVRHDLLLCDSLQIHLLQLPKYNPQGVNLAESSSLIHWLDFLRLPRDMSVEEIAARYPDPIFVKAAEVLEMISRTPYERELYEARLKLERDEQGRLDRARAEGREEGREEGERFGALMGKIQTLQQLLNVDVSPSDELKVQSEQALTQLAETLQTQLRNRDIS